MKKIPQLVFILGFFFLISCAKFTNIQVDKDLQVAYDLAGKNKSELESVLKYYSNSKKDSLKYKAAKFLITKIMPIGYYYEYTETEYQQGLSKVLDDSLKIFYGLESYGNFLQRSVIVENTLNMYQKKYGKFEENKKILRSDCENLSSTFLIENIELAFKAWEMPWSKGYNFDEFCKYILPYKSGNQKPNNWRRFFFENFSHFRDSIGNEADATIVCKKINDIFNKRKFIIAKSLANNPCLLLSKDAVRFNIYGGCASMSNMMLDVMRANGIPITEILMSRFGWDGNDHLLNAVLGPNREWKYFNGVIEEPRARKVHKDLTKTYRKGVFDWQRLTPEYVKAYQNLNLIGWDDISGDLTEAFDISPKLLNPNADFKGQVLYLCIFGNTLKNPWVPVDFAIINEKGLVFEEIAGLDVLYIVMAKGVYGEMIPQSLPFVMDTLGDLTYIKPKEKLISAMLKRKYPQKPRLLLTAKNLVGSRIEATNDINLKKWDELFQIDSIFDIEGEILSLGEVKYRYYRFKYPALEENKSYDIAKLAFFKKSNSVPEEVHGNYIYSKGFNKQIASSIFDLDLLTYASVQYKNDTLMSSSYDNSSILSYCKESLKGESSSWVGIDFGHSESISNIQYIPRMAKNGIYTNMDYELFYWDQQWISLGKRVGTKEGLKYDNIPLDALLWLRNNSEGKEERIFTLKNNNQIWW